ncbi:MAG: hypothetical protein JRF70_02820 [Deltaproteobacteria bacterium]|nr:hypothetical protein [Deltaproteobacteria bacterium]
MRRVFVPVLLVAVLVAARADATRVVDVRVGAHKGYTRVVLELDGPSEYRIRSQSLPSGGGSVAELTVELDSATGAFALGGRRGLVQSVRVKPKGKGAVALIRLTVDAPRVADMTLKGPHRIVIDVRPPAKKAAAPKAAPPPPPKPKPAPKRVAQAPQKPPAPPPASPLTTPPPKPLAGAAPPLGPDAPPGTEGPQGEPAPLGARAPRAPAKPRPQAPVPRRPEPSAAEEDDSGFGMLPIAAIVAALLAVWFFLRRRAQASDQEIRDTLPDFPPLDGLDTQGPADAVTVSEADLAGPGDGDEPEVTAMTPEDEDLPAQPGQVIPPPTPSVAAASAGETLATPPPKPTLAPEPAQAPFPGIAAAPAAAPDTAAERTLSEIERRLRHIETRIEEMADSRERLDRQLAAHTEELRVQRSAIARAQRVLRNLTRPDDGGDGPPSASGGS